MKRFLLVLLLCSSVSLGQYWKPPLGTLPDWGESINRGLVAWWIMNEGIGSHINDISLNGNHGELVGDTAWVGGIHGHALSFDGTGDYVDVGDPSNGQLDFGAEDFAIVAWVRPDATGWILQKGDSFSENFFRFYLRPSDPYVRFGVTENGGSEVQTTSMSRDITDSEWHHVVGQRSGDLVLVYVDGVLEASDAGADAIETSNGASFLIGAQFNNSVIGNTFNGDIDLLMVYNRALLVSELKQLSTMPFKGLPHD